MNLYRNKKALSPVVAAIILIAVTVAVSIAVAAWMGVLPLKDIGQQKTYNIEIPNYENATHVQWTVWTSATWIFNNIASSNIVSLPCNATFKTSQPLSSLALRVSYYKEVSKGLFQHIVVREFKLNETIGGVV